MSEITKDDLDAMVEDIRDMGGIEASAVKRMWLANFAPSGIGVEALDLAMQVAMFNLMAARCAACGNKQADEEYRRLAEQSLDEAVLLLLET